MPKLKYFDLIIRKGTVIDGTGAPRKLADIGIVENRIIEIGDLHDAESSKVINANGLIVSPGFIDVHTHDDNLIFTDPSMAPKTTQGVTSVIVGNCGISLAPLKLNNKTPPPPQDLLGGADCYKFDTFQSYVNTIKSFPPATNIGFLAGHGTLRLCAMHETNKVANTKEIEKMQEILFEAMNAGALGISTGLIYGPNKKATLEEISLVSEVAALNGGIYTTHMRDEGDNIIEAMDEAFAVGSNINIPVVISHHKCVGTKNYGKSSITLSKICSQQEKRAVSLDAYPYTAASTVILPEMVLSSEKVVITWSKTMPQFAGQDLEDICQQLGCDLIEAAKSLMPGGAIYFMMNEEDVQRILKFPDTMIGSDGLPHDKHPHPRLWGTFPRVLGHYSRDIKLFKLEEAIHKMTGLSASRFQIKDRGFIRKGAYADIVIFDSEKIIDSATFTDPIQSAKGIIMVLVNGKVIRENGIDTDARPGEVILRDERSNNQLI